METVQGTTREDIQCPEDRRQDLLDLKHKPGELEKYILNFNALANRAGYTLHDQENPMLAMLFLKGLHPSLRTKITSQKNPLKKLEEIIEDARAFDRSYYQDQQWKNTVMAWQPACQPSRPARDPNAMDIDRLTIDE